MKFRSFIWISGTALIVLAIVQYYFISETFKTKQEQFDSKYSSLAKLGLFDFENRYFDYEEDSILNIMDDFAYFSMHDVRFSNDEVKDSLYNQIFQEFQSQLNTNKIKDLFLKAYFKNAGEDSAFTSMYRIEEIYILKFGEEIRIFNDSAQNINIKNDGYLINTYTVERNYYRIKYGYYISFTHRSEQISREMLLTKTLSFITLLIVFSVFFLTLRNLLIQKRLSDMKTDFINNMTHELKTPLSTISVATSSLALGNSQMTRERVLEISGIIRKQNKHLSRLIDRILDISIWEKDQVRIEQNPVEINTFITELINEFCSIHPKAIINQHMISERKNALFAIDEVHMTTVMNNLLSNAVKYGHESPVIDLYIRLKDDLQIEIRDNGPGISKEEQKHIFEKFFRGKDSQKMAIRGLGLGLYYVKQIIEAHHGSITLTSSTSKGSIFNIVIPE